MACKKSQNAVRLYYFKEYKGEQTKIRENESLDDGVEQSLREQEEGNPNCPTPEMVEHDLEAQENDRPDEEGVGHQLELQEREQEPDEYTPIPPGGYPDMERSEDDYEYFVGET